MIWIIPSHSSDPAVPPPSPITLSDPGVAYVRSDGSDVDGEIGNPAAPFATWQGAIDDGATVFDFGAGGFGPGTLPGSASYYMRGRGIDSVLGAVTITNAGTTQLRDTGLQSVRMGDVTSESDFIGVGLCILGNVTAPGCNVTIAEGGFVLAGIDTGAAPVAGDITISRATVNGLVRAIGPTNGTISLRLSSVGSVDSDSLSIQGAVIGGIFYSNSYP